MKKQLNFKTLTTVGIKLSSKKDIKKFYKYAWKYTARADSKVLQETEAFFMNKNRKTTRDKTIVLKLVANLIEENLIEGNLIDVMYDAKDAIPLKDAFEKRGSKI